MLGLYLKSVQKTCGNRCSRSPGSPTKLRQAVGASMKKYSRFNLLGSDDTFTANAHLRDAIRNITRKRGGLAQSIAQWKYWRTIFNCCKCQGRRDLWLRSKAQRLFRHPRSTETSP